MNEVANELPLSKMIRKHFIFLMDFGDFDFVTNKDAEVLPRVGDCFAFAAGGSGKHTAIGFDFEDFQFCFHLRTVWQKISCAQDFLFGIVRPFCAVFNRLICFDRLHEDEVAEFACGVDVAIVVLHGDSVIENFRRTRFFCDYFETDAPVSTARARLPLATKVRTIAAAWD